MGLITISNLNSIGRVGNQLFLYAFAKGYALRHGCELQIPADWWGRTLFANVTEEPIHRPVVSKTLRENNNRVPLGYFLGQTNIDLDVYAQHQLYVDYYSREQVREWFRLKPEFECFAPPLGSYTAVHIRRGDYETNRLFSQRYCLISLGSYLQALDEHNIPEPVVQIGEGFRPTVPSLNTLGVGWLTDFLTLRNAAHLLRANSTFSLWAGWLGHGKVYSPVVGNKVGPQDVRFVEGNHSNTAGFFSNQSDLYLKEQ